MEEASSTVAENLARIRERIELAAQRAGRSAEEITLVGVSKTFPPSVSVKPLTRACGISAKTAYRNSKLSCRSCRICRLFGTLSVIRNGIRPHALSRLFHTVDSVDNLPLAEKLDHAAGDGRRLPVLIEVRLDTAPKKSGCEPADLPRLAEGVLLMTHLELRGLMTVPPVSSDPEHARPMFRRLRELRDEMATLLDWPLSELSMGMSHDFEIAIEEGATQIRVGTALFGTRPEDA